MSFSRASSEWKPKEHTQGAHVCVSPKWSDTPILVVYLGMPLTQLILPHRHLGGMLWPLEKAFPPQGRVVVYVGVSCLGKLFWVGLKGKQKERSHFGSRLF